MQLKIPNGGAGEELEIAPALVPILAVGLSDVPGAVQCLAADVVAYASGRCIATYSPDPSKVLVSEARREVRHITAVALSPDHKWIAVAEAMSNNEPAQVTLMDVKAGLECGNSLQADNAEDYNCVSFSGDGELVIASSPLNNQPATSFHVWDWRTSTRPSSSGTAQGFADKVSVNPRFTSNVFVQCNTAAFYMRLTSSGQYRAFPLEGLNKKPEVSFIDHCWLADGRMALALSDRRLLLVDGVAVQHQVQLSGPPACLAALPDGGLLAALRKGCVDLLRPSSTAVPGSNLSIATTIKPPGDDLVGSGAAPVACDLSFKSISVEPQGTRAALYLQGGPLLMLNVGLFKTKAVVDVAAGERAWEQMLPSCHTGPIISACVSMRRDYLVTASQDLTVRVWCWRLPFRLVALHQCHHAPLAVAIDPSGAEVVVTYVDCVRMYSVVEGILMEVGALQLPAQDGRPPQELAKCSRAAWSPTGHLLAIVGGLGGREILIFSPLHRTLVARLTGHFASIQDIAWSHNGLYLASASEGSLFTWHMEDFTRRQENSVKGCFNSAVACTPDFGTLVVGDTTQGIRLLETAAKTAADGSVNGSQQGVSDSPSTSSVASAWKPAGNHTGAGLPGGHSMMGVIPERSQFSHVSMAATAVGDKSGLNGTSALTVQGVYTGVVLPARGALQLVSTPLFRCCLGGGLRGSIRVCDLPPTSTSHYQEYMPHTSDITALVAHYEGRWVISADNAGTWMLHALLEPQAYQPTLVQMMASPRKSRSLSSRISYLHQESAAAAREAGLKAGARAGAGVGALGRGAGMAALPPFPILAQMARAFATGQKSKQEQQSDVLTVRGTDMAMLKENVRELRDKLGKAASVTEYKVYEKEQEIRRMTDAEIARLKSEVAALSTELQHSKREAEEAAIAAEQDAELSNAAAAAAVAAERERFESMIAVEIERTNASESESTRLKTRYGKRLAQMYDTHSSQEKEAAQKVALLQQHVGLVQQQAVKMLEKAHAKMEQEVRLDSELNEEEIGRVEVAAKAQVESREDKYMGLLAKYTLQGGIASQTQASNEELVRVNEALGKENTRLTEQATALKEELAAMHAAWADRDVKQRLTDLEVKELGHQVAQSRLYTQLATSRITELSSEIEPLKKGKADAQANIAKMEAVQVRNAEQRLKDAEHSSLIKAHLANARAELVSVKAAAAQQQAYWDNFTTQLFRLIHNQPVDKWAQVLGKLHAEFTQGKDKLDWRQYSDSNQSLTDQEMTESELRVQLREVQAQMLHNEKVLATQREVREREVASHRHFMSRLQAENVDMLAQLNQAKRDLKEALTQLDKRQVEIAMLRQGINPNQATGSPGRMRPDSRPVNTSPGARPSTSHMSKITRTNHGRPSTTSHLSDSAHTPQGVPAAGIRGSGAPTRALLQSNGEGASSSRQPGGTHATTSPARTRQPQLSDAPITAPPPPVDVVTGEMPSGGWWMGANNLFEVPATGHFLVATSGDDTQGSSSPHRPQTVASSVVSGGSRRGHVLQRPGTVGAVSVPHPRAKKPSTADSASTASHASLTPGTPSPAAANGMPPRLNFSPPTTAFSAASSLGNTVLRDGVRSSQGYYEQIQDSWQEGESDEEEASKPSPARHHQDDDVHTIRPSPAVGAAAHEPAAQLPAARLTSVPEEHSTQLLGDGEVKLPQKHLRKAISEKLAGEARPSTSPANSASANWAGHADHLRPMTQGGHAGALVRHKSGPHTASAVTASAPADSTPVLYSHSSSSLKAFDDSSPATGTGAQQQIPAASQAVQDSSSNTSNQGAGYAASAGQISPHEGSRRVWHVSKDSAGALPAPPPPTQHRNSPRAASQNAPLTGPAAAAALEETAQRAVSLPAPYLATLSGMVKPPIPSRLTTLGAGFRSYTGPRRSGMS